MAINSQSSPSEILDEYTDNLDYDLVGSPAKAQAFIKACRALLALRPEQSATDGVSNRFNHAQVETQMNQAQKWWIANGGRSGSRTASRRWDMRGLRS